MKKVNKRNPIVNDVPHNTFNNKTNKSILLLAIKKHKLGLLIVLFLILVSSTACWFIFNTHVDLGLQAHIKSWDFKIQNDGDEIAFNIDALYPGMNIKTDSRNLINNGEIGGTLSLDIKSIELFGVTRTDYTIEKSEDGREIIVKGFPFELKVSINKNVLLANTDDSALLEYTLKWDYENDEPECIATRDLEDGSIESYNKCDEEDTLLGEESFTFSNTEGNEDKPSLIIKIDVNIKQVDE